MNRKIFLCLDDDWRTDEDAENVLLTEFFGIEFEKGEVILIDEETASQNAIMLGAGIQAYVFIVSDEPTPLKGGESSRKLRQFESQMSGETCSISGCWDYEIVVVQYVVPDPAKFSDEQLVDTFLNDVSDASNQFSYLGAIRIDYEAMNFHSSLASEYLRYLDALVNYSEFGSKMTQVFDYVFSKLNEFYLKLLGTKNDMTSQFHDLRKIRGENSRAALMIQSIYSGLDFDEHTVQGEFGLIEDKYESIRTFTRSINEVRQSRNASSLNTIMFWVAIISFFFGMIAFYDKYQSSETFNVGALEAFFTTGLILLPFALLFLFVFLRNGVMFEGIGRLMNTGITKFRLSWNYMALRGYWKHRKHVTDPSWARVIEYGTTDLVSNLFPLRMVATDGDLEGLEEDEREVYEKLIKPRITEAYEALIKQIHWKVNELINEKNSVRIRGRKKQFELLVSEICTFTALNNWYLESRDIEKPEELHFLDNLILHSMYASWIVSLGADSGLISGIANELEMMDNWEVIEAAAHYMKTENSQISELIDSLADDDVSADGENVEGVILKVLFQMDSPFWDSDDIPVFLPDSYTDPIERPDGLVTTRMKQVVNQAIPLVRDAVWEMDIQAAIRSMEIELSDSD